MKSRFKRNLRGERGSITIFTGLAMLVILGMGAFVTDLGIGYIRANEVQNAADAAALAGAEELPLSDDSQWSSVVVPVVEAYAQENGIDDVTVTKVTNSSGKIIGVKAETEKLVDNTMIRALSSSNDTMDIHRDATARIFTVTEVSEGSGLVPIGINTDVLDAPGFDGSISLDIDPSDEAAVKYGWMFFDKAYDGNNNANSKLKDWMENGYDGTIKIGDELPWTNGSRSSTVMEYNDLVGQEVLAPVYEVINLTEGKNNKEDTANVRIVGFVVIRIEPLESGEKKNKDMRATFVKYANITGTPSDDEDIIEYRVYSSKLID